MLVINFKKQTTSGYIFIESFVDDYPILTGVDYQTSVQNIGEIQQMVYKVAFNENNAFSGFAFSLAFIEELQASGTGKVKMAYRSDGEIQAFCDYLDNQDGFFGQTVTSSAQWKDFAVFTIDELRSLHIVAPNTNNLPTYIEFCIMDASFTKKGDADVTSWPNSWM